MASVYHKHASNRSGGARKEVCSERMKTKTRLKCAVFMDELQCRVGSQALVA